ncbi:MAG: hypothetical protein PUC12_11375 [Clostridiales bacterium]|nr:hypothetical protein [Clostridiales bacterium]
MDFNNEDGLYYIYFYTDGTRGGTSEIKAMLNYIKESTQENVTNEATRKIHDYANKVKVEPEVRDAYMTFEDKIYYERKDAAKEATTLATLNTKIQDICELLKDYGPIPDELVNRLSNEKDICILTKWLKLAAKADSIEEFTKAISEQDS